MDSGNVIVFEPRRAEVPALTHVEVHLNTEDCSLGMTVYDSNGDSFDLAYKLGWAPPDFDLDRLRAAWDKWRGTSAAAS